MRRHQFVLAATALMILAAVPAGAYLKLGSRFGPTGTPLRWQQFPVRYHITDRAAAGVTPQQLQAAVARAFNTWHVVETAETSSQFVGFTQAVPLALDGMNVIGFSQRTEPAFDRVLAQMSWTEDTIDGRMLESDIFFNSVFPWSTAEQGTVGRHDVESIAVHEIGHLLGLGHSAIGETEMQAGGRRVIAAETVMFPIAFSAGSVVDRVLKADDVAGISDIYGTTAFRREFGSVSGRVTKNGQGVTGAHVTAFDPRTGRLVGGFTVGVNGSFAILGLTPGPHVLRVEPLDDADITSFFAQSVPVDVNFNVKFYEQIVMVPRGGGATNIEIRVTPK